MMCKTQIERMLLQRAVESHPRSMSLHDSGNALVGDLSALNS